MLNKYYQKHKKRLQKEVHERYQILSGKERDKRRKKILERYKNLPKERKQKLGEYMKKHYVAHSK